MHLIKLNAIGSTNSYLRQLSSRSVVEDFTVVVANHQTKGRGQMGSQWSSQQGRNLTVSVFKDVSFLKVDEYFFISMAVALAILEALKAFEIKGLTIKWPNDILSDNKKIGGILIENVISLNKPKASIIGFGLNINQTEFENLPSASSLRLISGRVFDLEEVLQAILNSLKCYFSLLEKKAFNKLKSSYEQQLFRKDKPSTFKNPENQLFTGYILGVSKTGNLQVLIEDEIVKEFDLKEVALLY
ncbi:BirA family biotin operon repressor/biotin-[acetyl-CoA-carboxylase] ligase [Flavobacteriaceae bacterium MAR_2010_72]|nr:BirA family biotin operon repressor/biotin-[acetyl-CoA-carboxylase] ligase [Flavobacteriaceae bacterium MAR_2010_72]TVZ58957.1 BirA family biotin operon repressor/biotin-[acetyl-CoA-carboxylase] ligase [Flavobacteriaceae bacterium MAR_2010_105]